jgi:hypothetical protein
METQQHKLCLVCCDVIKKQVMHFSAVTRVNCATFSKIPFKLKLFSIQFSPNPL